MTAFADASTMPVWSTRDWLLVLGVLALAVVVAWVRRRKVTLPAAVPAPVAGRCAQRGCTGRATEVVRESPSLGGGTRVVCKSCCEYGEHPKVGWWTWIDTNRPRPNLEAQ